MVGSNATRAGFTLIELLVVIAIIAVLMGLLVPAVQKVRDSAARTQCQNNLKQLGLALHNYETALGAFPPCFNGWANGKPKTSWMAVILPYIEQTQLAQLYNFQLNYDDPGNAAAVAVPVAIVNCPATPGGPRFDITPSDDERTLGPRACTDYAAANGIQPYVATYLGAGSAPGPPLSPGPPSWPSYGANPPTANDPRINGVLARDASTRITDVLDGTSNTIMIGEDAARPDWYGSGQLISSANNLGPFSANKEGGWCDPNAAVSLAGSIYGCRPANAIGPANNAGLATDACIPGAQPGAPCPMNCTNDSEFYSFHSGGCNVVFADGSVHFLNQNLQLWILAALCTRAGNELVGDWANGQ